MVAIWPLLLTPVPLGAMIYGATQIFSHKQDENLSDNSSMQLYSTSALRSITEQITATPIIFLAVPTVATTTLVFAVKPSVNDNPQTTQAPLVKPDEDEKQASLREEAFSQIVEELIQNDELEQFEDIIENLAMSQMDLCPEQATAANHSSGMRKPPKLPHLDVFACSLRSIAGQYMNDDDAVARKTLESRD
ncbi:hypothetical protein BC939DRAFT_504750 [Gamsiella multidivaricata]|uniref:uncharacterized protein n=1 Tax=Gamsiella multidivaricata TaxID=101098 RepID=UPI002220FCAB|nr:uncharacterized protein BC939DRAFT_504750 [Gamsiella multidivaricata]KAI7820776.1 hypothetical protein BC939DRAFT_504750 [Gamsiella multidivaricata]